MVTYSSVVKAHKCKYLVFDLWTKQNLWISLLTSAVLLQFAINKYCPLLLVDCCGSLSEGQYTTTMVRLQHELMKDNIS